MTQIKKMAANFAAFLVVLVVFGAMMTSCTGSEDIKETLAAPKTYTEYKTVTVQNYINSYSWFVNNNVYVNGVLGLTYNIENQKTIIEMPVALQGMPTMSGNAGSKWNWSDGQVTATSVETYNTDSLTIWGNISPLYEKSTPTRLHEKVLKIDLVWLVDGGFKLSNRPEVKFSREETRSHYQVDPSVRVDTVTLTNTEIEYVFKEIHDTTIVEKHDTTYIVNNVEVHDTVYVEVIKEVEKEIVREVFVQGAEINTSISNNWGYSVATMNLGSTHLLTLNIRHQKNPIAVENYGASLTSAASATEWSFDDGQLTNSNSSTNNCTISSITMTGVEKEEIEGVGCLIKTTFHVTGYYTNENGDRKDFAFDMVPMYLQTKEATPEPQIVTPETTKYRGIIRKISVDGLKLMSRPVVQKFNSEAGSWEDIRTASRVCIGLSGSPSGLDLFVKSRKVVEENEDSHWYTATGNAEMDKQWIGEDKKDDGTIVYRNTKVYNFNFMFTADAVNEGLVGPQTELYVMKADKVTVTDPDGNALVCTWEDGSEFSLGTSVRLNDTKYVDDPALVGKTRTESDKLYKYDTTFTQNFTASIGGKELQNVEAKSPLWIPAE